MSNTGLRGYLRKRKEIQIGQLSIISKMKKTDISYFWHLTCCSSHMTQTKTNLPVKVHYQTALIKQTPVMSSEQKRKKNNSVPANTSISKRKTQLRAGEECHSIMLTIFADSVLSNTPISMCSGKAKMHKSSLELIPRQCQHPRSKVNMLAIHRTLPSQQTKRQF